MFKAKNTLKRCLGHHREAREGSRKGGYGKYSSLEQGVQESSARISKPSNCPGPASSSQIFYILFWQESIFTVFMSDSYRDTGSGVYKYIYRDRPLMTLPLYFSLTRKRGGKLAFLSGCFSRKPHKVDLKLQIDQT